MYEDGSGTVPGGTVVATVKRFNPVKGFGFLTAGGRLARSLLPRVGGIPRGMGHAAGGRDRHLRGRAGPAGSAGCADPFRRRLDRVHGSGERRSVAAQAVRKHAWGLGLGQSRRVAATVKWFDPAKGFGFLVPDDGSPDVFCHASVVRDAGYDTLPEGATVTCEVAEGRRGPAVSSIVAVDASSAAADPLGGAGPGYDRRDRGRGRDGTGGAVEECRGVVKF